MRNVKLRATGLIAAAVFSTAMVQSASAVGIAASTVQPSNWFRADAINGLNADGTPKPQPTPNTYIQVWSDSSGNNFEANQGPGTNRRPTYRASGAGATGSLPVVRFNLNADVPAADGSAYTPDEFMNILPGPLANTPSSKLTAFVVSKDSGQRSTQTATRSIVLNTRTNGNSANGFFLGYGTTPATGVYAHVGHSLAETNPPVTLQTQTYEDNGFNLTELSRDGLTSVLSHYTNTGSGSTTATWGGTDLSGNVGFTPSTLTRTQLGTEGGFDYFFGDIAEIVLYNGTTLGTRDTQIVTNYLGEKYGITSADLADLPGDTNTDYQVNFDDLLTLAQNYGMSGNRNAGDFNGDGVINFDDLLLLAQNYGSGVGTLVLPTGTSETFASDFALAQSMAPEPTALALLALSASLLRRRRV